MTTNRIFIAFAVEDEWARDYLVGQARNENSPFSFTDMSVKEPWDDAWKRRCRTRISGCDGLIAMISKSTRHADGQLWEIGCALDEGVPVLGIYTTKDDRPGTLPVILRGVRVKDWSWANIGSFLDKL